MINRKSTMLSLALVGILFLAGCGNKAPQSNEIKVNTYAVAAETVETSDTFSGPIEAGKNAPIRAKVSGYIVEKYVHGGERVHQGQALYKIDGRTYDAALAAAQANSAQAGVAAQTARADLDRYQVLIQHDAVSQQVFDAQRAKAEQALEAYKASQAQVAIAQESASDTVIRAPFDGTLAMDTASIGTFVAAGQTPLGSVQSSGPITVTITMNDAQYAVLTKVGHGNIKSIDKVQMKLADGSIYKNLGTITEVSRNLDSTGQITAKVTFTNDGSLLPGMFVTLLVPGEEVKNALLVPTKSIVQILDKFFVYVVEPNGQAKQIPVTKGSTTGAFTVITKGIKAGDEVVVDGVSKIHGDVKLIPTKLSKEQISKG